MDDCIFCKIVKGEIPSFKLYETDNVFCFLDIYPSHPGHTLIIPKEHADNVKDLPAEAAKEIILAGQKLIEAMDKALSPDGYNFIQSNGKVAGQEVMHYHMHIVPRYKKDNVDGAMNAFHPEGYEYKPSNEELEKIAEKIKVSFN